MLKRSCSLIAGLIVLAPFICSAQQATGTIIGTVQDSSGSVIPNATVSLAHAGTDDSRVVKTNERGEFTSAFMRIGEYVVTAEAAGFKKRVAEELTAPFEALAAHFAGSTLVNAQANYKAEKKPEAPKCK